MTWPRMAAPCSPPRGNRRASAAGPPRTTRRESLAGSTFRGRGLFRLTAGCCSWTTSARPPARPTRSISEAWTDRPRCGSEKAPGARSRRMAGGPSRFTTARRIDWFSSRPAPGRRSPCRPARWRPTRTGVSFRTAAGSCSSEPSAGVRSEPGSRSYPVGCRRAVTPEGAVGVVTSPDGQWVAAVTQDSTLMLFPLQGGEPRPVAKLALREAVSQWSADGRTLFVSHEGTRLDVFGIDVQSGKRQLWKTFEVPDPAGVRVSELRRHAGCTQLRVRLPANSRRTLSRGRSEVGRH